MADILHRRSVDLEKVRPFLHPRLHLFGKINPCPPPPPAKYSGGSLFGPVWPVLILGQIDIKWLRNFSSRAAEAVHQKLFGLPTGVSCQKPKGILLPVLERGHVLRDAALASIWKGHQQQQQKRRPLSSQKPLVLFIELCYVTATRLLIMYRSRIVSVVICHIPHPPRHVKSNKVLIDSALGS